MTGLVKMKEQILDEARITADNLISEANAEAEKILAEAKSVAEAKATEISRKSESEVAKYKDRVVSSIDLQRRTQILAAKQEVIAEVLEKAYDNVENMESEKYFSLLLKLLAKNVLSEEGEIYFSSKDLNRLPHSFDGEVSKIAEQKGGKLVIAKESKNIDNGFILVYGGIEENCTIRAIFNAKKDELSDKVNKTLFV
jgi:V/A-type H+-transporting ATPase subunit E